MDIIQKQSLPVAIGKVVELLAGFGSVARVTIVRDLSLLIALGYLEKQGRGRGVKYLLSNRYELNKPIDPEAYFRVGPDERQIHDRFDFAIFDRLDVIFSDTELTELAALNRQYQANMKRISPTLLKREYERLTIELSWKSSQLEGNTYTLLETEYLLKEHAEPKGHPREEATMIINHKTALDYISKNANLFKKLSVRQIEDVHYLLTKDLDVPRNLRQRIVRISGTKYAPLNNQHQIREAVAKLCRLINKQKSVFDKVITALLLIAYIQPFEDGNKRTSRLIGNGILLAHDACPLSFRSIKELEYKKAVLLFYEQHNVRYFKQLFMEQFAFAVNNYFGA